MGHIDGEAAWMEEMVDVLLGQENVAEIELTRK